MPREKRLSPNHHDIHDSGEQLCYEIKATENARAITITVRCCRCRNPLLQGKGGWCEECQTWPINIAPLRFCERNHPVNADGWCVGCNQYVLTELVPRDRQWIDTRSVRRRLTREEITILPQEIAEKLSGPGWPEKIVPLRDDYIPRSWKRGVLRKTGTTPLGYRIVIPDHATVDAQSDTPF